MSDETRRVIIKVTGDTKDAERGLQRVDKEAKQASTDLAKMGATGKTAMETIGLGAEAQVPRLQRLANEFQGFTGKIGSGISAIDSFAKSMGPWNQALELGGKALRFGEAALDAYAKKSTAAAAEVNALKKAITDAKDEAMAAAGWFLMDSAKGAGVQGGGVGQNLKAFNAAMLKKRVGSMYGDDETLNPFLALESAAKGLKETITGNIDHWNTDGTAWLSGMKDNIEKTAEATKKAATEAARWRAEMAAFSSKTATSLTDDLVKRLDREVNGVDPGPTKLPSQTTVSYEQAQDAVAAAREALDELAGAPGIRAQSLLESAFGPVEEFDFYKQGFETLGQTFAGFSDAVAGGYEAIVTGQGSVSAAFKRIFADSMLVIGKASVVSALHETALGFGKLALGPLGGVSATAHFKAAAMHGVVAVAAGAAASALGAGSGSTAGGATTGGAGGGRPNGGTVNSNTERPERSSTVIVYADPFAEGTPGVRRRSAKKVLERAGRSQSWEDS
jgi:hypothetical protein